MHSFIEYFKFPFWVTFSLMLMFGMMQGVGAFLDFKGKVVPEFMNMRKRVQRKRTEKEAIAMLPELLEEHKTLMADNKQVMQDYKAIAEENKKLSVTNAEMVKTISESNELMREIKSHYSADNIAKRDGWMKEVNEHIANSEQRKMEQDEVLKDLSKKLDRNNADTLEILINNKRDYLLNFTTKAADMNCPLTKEQYQRFFTVHREYEQLIEENGKVNGQVDVAYDIVTRSFEERMRKHAFIEDGGYNF